MKPRILVLALCVAALHTVAAAQETFFSEVVEVRVTNVDVIVTGKDGKPVRGLTRDDFEVFEDGVKKEISNFAEVREERADLSVTPSSSAEAAQAAPIAPQRRRHITIFIDNAMLEPVRRNVVLPHLRTFLQQQVRPSDEVAIVVWTVGLQVVLEPTSDPAAIDKAVQQLASWTTFAFENTANRSRFVREIDSIIRAAQADQEAPSMGEALLVARRYAQNEQHDIRSKIAALKSVMASMRGASGRKVLVLLTQSLPTNPSEDYFAYLDALQGAFGGQGQPLMDARDFELHGLVTEVAQAANSSGVSLYPIDAQGLRGDVRAASDASNSGQMTQQSMQVLETSIPTLRAIAAETGGVALVGSTNYALAFQTIANDLTTYYSLGYRASGERQDRMKRVEVRLKNNKRFAVRTRTAVIEQTLSSEMHDAVAANLFRTVNANELAIRAVAGTTTRRAEGDEVVVPLTVTIPLDRLTLVPDGEDLAGSYSLYAAFLRRDGAVSKVAQQKQQFRFPAASRARRKELTLKLDVTMDVRTSTVSVGVLDEASRATGFAAVTVVP